MRYVTLAALAGIIGVASLAHTQPPYVPPGDEAAYLARHWIESYLRRGLAPGETGAIARDLRRRPPVDVLASILASDEYHDFAGGTRAGHVNRLILDLGHRQPGPREINDNLRRLRGRDRLAVAQYLLRQYPTNWQPGLH